MLNLRRLSAAGRKTGLVGPARAFSATPDVFIKSVTSCEKRETIDSLQRYVEVEFSDGAHAKFHEQWLVDHDPAYVHPTSLQRQLVTAELLTNEMKLNPFLKEEGTKLLLEVKDGDNDIESVIEYPASFLRGNTYSEVPSDQASSEAVNASAFDAKRYFSPFTLWNASNMNKEKAPTFLFSKLLEDKSLHAEALQTLDRVGMMVVKGTPTGTGSSGVQGKEYHDTRYLNKDTENLMESSRPHAVQTEQLIRELFGCPRETFYGRMWDTAPKVEDGESKVVNDTAYTKDALHLHTDGSYWFDMPGLQVFNCVAQSESPEVAGNELEGCTRVLDGFDIMKQIAEEQPETFRFFTSTKLRWMSKEEGVFAQAMDVPFKLNLSYEENSSNTTFRYNNYDLGCLTWLPFHLIPEYYHHNSVLTSYMRKDENMVRLKLAIGDMLIINNQRVCHGREAFTGYRNMVGCYVGKDEWVSRLRLVRG